MPQQHSLFGPTPPVAIASLDDASTDTRHRAFLSDNVVSWSVDGAFLRSFRLTSTTKPPPPPSDSQSGSQEAAHILFARFSDCDTSNGMPSVALCIFGSDTLAIHCHSGESFAVALPFGVQSVAALREGIVVQRRAADPHDSSPFSPTLPAFFGLLGVRSEFKMLGISRPTDLDAARKIHTQGLVLSPTPAKHTSPGAVPVFNDPNATLVAAAVTPSRSTSPRQFLLCWDAAAQRHTLYQCVVLDQPAEPSSQRDAASNAHTDSLSAGSTSASDTERMSASRPRLSRQPSLSVHRRSSVAVSAAAAMAAVSRRKSGYGSAVKNDRRGSLLGRVSFNDSPGIGYAADIFSEQRLMRAEIVLHLRWKDKRPKEEADRAANGPPGAAVCVVQTASGRDVVCVLNKAKHQIIGIDALSFAEVFRCSALAMASVRALWHSLDDLVVVDPSGCIALVAIGGSAVDKVDDAPSGCDLISLNTAHQGHVLEIVGSEGCTLSVAVDSSESRVSISVRIEISRLAVAILRALSLVLSRTSYFLLWRTVVASLVNTTDALSEIDRIASLLLHGSDRVHPTPVALALYAKNEVQDRSAAVMFVLQLVYEDASLYSSEPQSQLSALGRLLRQLAHRAGFVNASLYYLGYAFFPEESTELEHSSTTTSRSSGRSQHQHNNNKHIVPSLAKWAIAAFASKNARPPMFPTLSDAREIFDITDSEPVRGAHESLALLDSFTNVVYNIAAGHDPMRVVQHLAAAKSSNLLLSQMRPELQWVVWCAMLRLRDLGTAQWPDDVLRFLGRLDLIANSGVSIADIDGGGASGNWNALGGDIGSFAARDDDKGSEPADSRSIADLCDEIRDLSTAISGKTPGPKTTLSAEYQEVGQSVFNADLRVEEVERLLDSTSVTYTTGTLVSTESVEELDEAKMRYMDLLARRVFALPLGQSLLKYSTCNLNPQDSLTASPPRAKARFRGNKVETDWSAEESDVCWPLFHSGVAAALTIERDQLRQAHPSWVLLHWPSEAISNADNAADEETKRHYKDALSIHAGFLFGMGLIPGRNNGKQSLGNGPLCDMPPWQAFKYLSIRHGLTSSALLLGRACAHRGTMDSSLSKILSLHIPNLLPSGSAEMMLLSYGTQAAAMLGLGLLFMGSQNRRMAEVMLHELSNIKRAAPDITGSRAGDADPAEGTAECYSLASGFALGLVALGQGLMTRTLADLCLLDALSEMLAGPSASGNAAHHRSAMSSDGRADDAYSSRFKPMASSMFDRPNTIDVGSRVSDLGVIAAIGFVFLGTNYNPAAQRLALPTTFGQLKVADPFTVLWKTLMQSLVMLDHIRPQKEWVESMIPSFPGEHSQLRSADIQRIRLHIVSASCFAMALKYAGTENSGAHSTILAYFDELTSIAGRPALGYEASLTRSSAQLCLDIVCISAALVMAGSGDIDVMKRLRALHGVSGNRSYGNHMASHMALGILFLGGGARFTVSRSRDSIALLVIAFFPRFPQHYSDNSEHLQAWRHLWSLCVEPRCLVVRDAITGRMCVDATATLLVHNGTGTTRFKPISFPATMLSLKKGSSMRLQAPGYIPLTVDLDQTTGAPTSTANRSVLYMQPRNPLLMTRSKAPFMATDRLQQQYQDWLGWIQTQVLSLIEQLADDQNQGALRMASEDITRTLSAVKMLQVFVDFSASQLFVDVADATLCFEEDRVNSDSNSRDGWVETTYLTWLAVRRSVLEFGCMDVGRRTLAEYWSNNGKPASSISQSQESRAFYASVGLLHTVLDLPMLTDMQEVLRHDVPVSSLINYYLTDGGDARAQGL
ncbi:Anaphase-promoting complex subunit 1 [Coemansia sp. RSA 1933]|nr:Anaphase-promoting complex subunit 1 [Coemansia sp. RSA 1933]